jgi:hypothetical protein
MGKRLITLPMLNRALYDVQTELENWGVWWEPGLYDVDVCLVPLPGTYHGLYCPKGWLFYSRGRIHIPAVSLSRLWELWRGSTTSLRDVVRHEYCHALVDYYPKLFGSRFDRIFRNPLEVYGHTGYHPEIHVSTYAAKNKGEHFAETGMLFLKHGGRMPARWEGTPIADQWEFIRKLFAKIQALP